MSAQDKQVEAIAAYLRAELPGTEPAKGIAKDVLEALARANVPAITTDAVVEVERAIAALRRCVDGDSNDDEILAGHHVADLVEERILPGLAAGLRPNGGMDGFVLSYGDGTDDDTLHSTLGSALTGWVVDMTLTDGTTIPVVGDGTERGEDGYVQFRYRLFDADAGDPVGPVLHVPFADVVGLTIS